MIEPTDIITLACPSLDGVSTQAMYSDDTVRTLAKYHDRSQLSQ
jgi:hypothetical protein